MIAQPSGTPVTQKKTSYAWNYEYNPSGANSVRPHAPTHIGERTYSHDANGNQLGWDNDNNGTRRNIVWDEENRIQSVFDNGHEKFYKYDDSGERVIKRGPQGETVYVNQYFTLRNREVGTKHVFVGQNRAVSKLMKQDKPGANPQGKTPVEKDLYYFHPDHLGSSNLITDSQGQPFEHLEYFPFGETWVEESSNTQRTPYLFTAKELDEETGLYYFGARYYDPRTSVWQSADPILSQYLDGKPNGGVYHSTNLGLYAYAHHRPVNMFDPDGNAPDIFENRIRHEQAVKMEISRLRKMGFTNFQTDVRLSINLGEGKSAIRVADIAAMKPGQSLSEAEFHEVKTVKKAEKLTAKNAAGTIFKKFLKVSDMFNVVEKIGRGASVINQMKKDIALDELGATVQRTGEPTTDGAQMKWSIYEHDSKGNLKRKGPTFPITKGGNVGEQFEKQYLDR